jgi:hypothetical protein
MNCSTMTGEVYDVVAAIRLKVVVVVADEPDDELPVRRAAEGWTRPMTGGVGYDV